MMRRWIAPAAALLFTVAIISASVFASWQLFSTNGAQRQSTVAGAQVRSSIEATDLRTDSAVRDGARRSADNRLIRSIEEARRYAAQRRAGDTASASSATVGDVLTYFNVMLYGPPAAPPEPTVGEVLVFFNALLYEPGATPPTPTIADTLIFFHALLYGGESTAAPLPTALPAAPVVPPPAPTSTPAPHVPATPVPPPPPAASNDVWTEAAFTQAVWDGVNARRAQQGLAPVTLESRLYAAARAYAVLIAEDRWFSHTGPDGSSFVDRIVAAGFPFTVEVGEVLAMGSHDWPASGVVQAWIDSAPHREQLLNPQYTRAGLECAFSLENGIHMVRCVMEFAAS